MRADSSVTFAPGACTLSQPATGSNGRTVFVDPGHGGLDPGVTATVNGTPVTEDDVTLAMAKWTRAALLASGYRVVLSRGSDTNVVSLRSGDARESVLTAQGVKRDLEARNACANAAGADALVAIHLNSFSDPTVGGAQTLYNPKRGFSPRSRTLALALQRSVVTSLGAAGLAPADRGVITDQGAGAAALTADAAAYGQLLQLGPSAPPWFRLPSLMPGAVVEAGFLTSAEEAARLVTASGQRTVADGLVAGLQRYFNS